MKLIAEYFYRSDSQNIKSEDSKEKQKDLSKSGSESKGSFWCPKIFFNHKCFSGPFLSKGKLAQLPKSVGPGPVTLVMKEVLSMLISVAYISSRVLRELQCKSKPQPGMHLEVLKAKSVYLIIYNFLLKYLKYNLLPKFDDNC